MKPLSAGSEIDAWCTRCRMDLMHRVVAMVGSAPKRVICLTCNSEHNYRAPRAAKPAPGVFVRNRQEAKPAPKTAEAKHTAKVVAEQERMKLWSAKTLGNTTPAFTKYSMERSFEEGELLLHSKFGEGYVERVMDGAKISVMFRDGAKVLAHRGRA